MERVHCEKISLEIAIGIGGNMINGRDSRVENL